MSQGHEQGQRGQNPLDPLGIWELVNAPELRWHEVPGGDALAGQLMLAPEDPYLAELFSLKVQEQHAKAVLSRDPFHGNYPPQGTLARLGQRIPLMQLPTGDVLSVGTKDMCKNTLVCGPTGGGKTNLLRLILAGLSASQASVIAFDRKGDLLDAKHLSARKDVLCLRWDELKLNLLQPPQGMSVPLFVNGFVELLGRHARLEASKRLASETLSLLFQRERNASEYPTLQEWMHVVESLRAPQLSRMGQYREAVLYVLKQLAVSFGKVIQYKASNCLDVFTRRHGLTVIRTDGLAVESASFLASVIVNSAYETRAISEASQASPLIFLLDDALPLISMGSSADSEGATNPLANWWFMARARGMGFVVASQNFSLVSPVVRNNTDCVMVCGSYGRDAEELSRYMNLAHEQAALLPVLRPGSAVGIARSTWPLAVAGRVPLLPPGALPEEKRNLAAEAFLGGVEAIPEVEEKRPTTTLELSPHAVSLLTKACLEPGTPLMKLYSELGLHGDEGKRAVSELEARGMVRVQEFPRKGRGGTPKALEPLPLGIAELEKRGIKPAERVIARGGWKHDVYARWLKGWCQGSGYACWFERTLGPKAFDCVFEENGSLIGIEICLSGSGNWNASQALKAAGVVGVAKVILAVEEKKFADGILQELKSLDALGMYASKIEVALLSKYSPW